MPYNVGARVSCLYSPTKPWTIVLPVNHILGKVPLMLVYLAESNVPTIPHSFAYQKQRYFEHGCADHWQAGDRGVGSGSQPFKVNSSCLGALRASAKDRVCPGADGAYQSGRGSQGYKTGGNQGEESGVENGADEQIINDTLPSFPLPLAPRSLLSLRRANIDIRVTGDRQAHRAACCSMS